VHPHNGLAKLICRINCQIFRDQFHDPQPDGVGKASATHVYKILKGTPVSHLPIEFPTMLELVINLKTAKVLGITVPPSLFARANEVIE
jgi:ABC-type uncharacterized transport system substrate-binding protein